MCTNVFIKVVCMAVMLAVVQPLSYNGTANFVTEQTISTEATTKNLRDDNVKVNISTEQSSNSSRPDVSSVSANISVVTDTTNKNFTSIETEGGSITVPVSRLDEQETDKTIHSNEVNSESSLVNFGKNTLQNIDVENDHLSVVARKGVSPKIVPRKGADPVEDTVDVSVIQKKAKTGHLAETCQCCHEDGHEILLLYNASDPKCVCCNDSDRVNVSLNGNSSIQEILEVDQSLIKTVKPDNISNNSHVQDNGYKSFPPLKKKSKPLVTLDEDKDIDQHKPNQLSTTEKSDFIIPVVALILAVPLIIVLGMVFYKKGSEFWERRHYRRMDFLIDGIYND